MKASTLTRALGLLAACFALSASAHAGVVLSGGGLALVEEGGVIASGNLSATGTSTAFAKDLLPGYPSHQIPNLNDQLFGNAESWIGNTTGTFAGVSFGGTAVQVSSIAFGRDNNGVFTDRTLGTYTLQYTTAANPTNATTAWTTIGTLNYQSAGGTNFAFPSKRHRYTFNTVAATGIRLLVPAGGLSGGTCIDELEAYSGIVVTNNADSGAGSLRQALINVGVSETITFAAGLDGGTIALSSGQLTVNKPLIIDASSLPNGITIDAMQSSRAFIVTGASTATIRGLTIINGRTADGNPGINAAGGLFGRPAGDGDASLPGGGILNAGTLTLEGVTITNCGTGNGGKAGNGIIGAFGIPTSASGVGGASGSGGGIANQGILTMRNCTLAESFTGNGGEHGNGKGADFGGKSGDGGGLFNTGTLTLEYSTITGNRTGLSGVVNSKELGSPFGTVTPLPRGFGGGIHTSNGSSTMSQTVVAANTAEAGPDFFGTLTSFTGVNFIGNPAGAAGLGTFNTHFFTGDALLEALSDNGGPTYTCFPKAGSPLIDPAGSLSTTGGDQRGHPRLHGSSSDIGAVESSIAFVDARATGTNDGRSWRNAYTFLQDPLHDEFRYTQIWVAEGAYYPDEGTGQTDNVRTSTFTLKDRVVIYGGFAGTESRLSERNHAAHRTILTGDIDKNDEPSFPNRGGNAYHVLSGDGTNTPITSATILDGFTITAGNANGSSPNNIGGGIYNEFSSPTLTNCSFQGNRATNGGGIYNNSSSSPTITNCSFQGNRAANGGGIYNNSSSSPTLANCSFQGNSATSDGGGIYNNSSSSPTLTNCIIWNNQAGLSTTSPSSSVRDNSSTPTYSYCLIQGYTKDDLNTGSSPDTNLAPNNPLFIREIDPITAPITTGGDLRLRGGSPAIDAGDNTKNPTSTDLGGQPRFIDGNQDNIATIDLGAYESDGGPIFVNATVSDGTGDGTSWANAFRHLQSALAVASAGAEIWVAKGTYYPDEGTGQSDNNRTSTFALKPGVAIYGGFAGTETSFSQRDPSAHPTTLSGDIGNPGDISDNAYQVLRASGAAITATTILGGFTITAGNANGSFPNNTGGGIYNNSSSSPTLTNCSFQGNSASQWGGGIYNSTSSPTLTNCSFQGNSASLSGGGIYNFDSSPTLTNCSFQGNSATQDGGGIYNDRSLPTLTNCSFQGNVADYGGGICNEFSSPILNNCSFQGNSADFGGGIFNEFSSLILNNCIIWRNKDSSGTGTASSSVFNDSNAPIYSHCLIQGYSKSELDAGSSPGTNLAPNAPHFVREVDPNTAPNTTGGDLCLLTGSPALNVGNNDANSTATDLAGNPRKVGTIDLGAYEGAFVTFAHLGYSDPNGDANGNGITNFGDYAAGGNPSAPDDPSLHPKLIGNQLTFSFRDNAADITKKFQKSTTLLPGSWNPLVLTTDYTVSSSTSSGGRSLQTLTLTNTLLTGNPKLFFREEFKSVP
jgi:hypothetical protein